MNRVIAKAEVFFEKSVKIIAIGSHRMAITFIAIIMAIYRHIYGDKKNKHVPFCITINISIELIWVFEHIYHSIVYIRLYFESGIERKSKNYGCLQINISRFLFP